MSRACPQAPADGGGASCFHCGQAGHMSSECTAAPRAAVRSSVDRDGGGSGGGGGGGDVGEGGREGGSGEGGGRGSGVKRSDGGGGGGGDGAPAAATVQLCRAFQRGECPRGDRCRFAHAQ